MPGYAPVRPDLAGCQDHLRPIYCRASAPDPLIEKFCLALIAKRDSIVWDIGGPVQPPLPLDRMARESPATPQDVPLHPAAAAVWRAHGFLD